MMRVRLTLLAALALTAVSACAPSGSDIREKPQGVGFDDYNDYLSQQRRDAELAGRPAPPAQPAPTQTAAQRTAGDALEAIGQPRGGDASAVLVAGPGADASGLAGGGRVVSTSTPSAPNSNNPNLSDEQNFDAVSSRQTIQSDAQRRAQQSAQYQVISPQAVPQRPRGVAPTPIEFALETQHQVGQNVYKRRGNATKAQRECAKYRTPDIAQDAFLKAGGPKRDRAGLDPDGDGFVCGWSPQKYRSLR